jgi:hypothetical protein
MPQMTTSTAAMQGALGQLGRGERRSGPHVGFWFLLLAVCVRRIASLTAVV